MCVCVQVAPVAQLVQGSRGPFPPLRSVQVGQMEVDFEERPAKGFWQNAGIERRRESWDLEAVLELYR